MRAGLKLAYGCSSGNCGACKARVVSGEVWKTREHDYVLSGREKQMGYILTCSNTAVTDVVLEAAEAATVDDLPEQEIRAGVRKIERLGEDMIQLQVQTPRTQTLRFMAGQRARLTLEDGAQRGAAHRQLPLQRAQSALLRASNRPEPRSPRPSSATCARATWSH